MLSNISTWVSEGKKMTAYAQRRERLLSLARGKQVVALTPPNVFWLTGFWGGGAAIVLPDRTVVITSPLEEDRVRETGREAEVVVVQRWADVPGAVMKRLRKGSAVTEDPALLRGHRSVAVDPELFLKARRVKDPDEMARIRKASEGLDRVFEEVQGELRPGRTEWEVAAEVMKLATMRGLTPSGSDSALSPVIVASGPNGALPHSELTGRRIRRGDFVVVDIFFRFRGYNSDATRTFAVGIASAEMKRHYLAVREAQEAALQAVGSGVVCEDVHMAAVKVLRRHGVERYLSHSVGHGVGIDIHELPSIAKGSREKLVRGDVITDEPGIYIPGKHGIRIEDTIIVGSRPTAVTKFTKDLVTCG